jgi:hypothetical protein
MAMELYVKNNLDNYLLIATTVIILLSSFISVIVCKNNTDPPENDTIDDAICEILHGHTLSVHEILAEIKPVFPEILKGEINSRLYTMLSKKNLQKTVTGKRPMWSLV